MAHAMYREPRKATRVRLLGQAAPHTRMFHLTRFAFFLCFFGWFGIAPLMAVVRKCPVLSKAQIGNTIIASVASPSWPVLHSGGCATASVSGWHTRPAGERTALPEMCGPHKFSDVSQSNVRASVGPTLA